MQMMHKQKSIVLLNNKENNNQLINNIEIEEKCDAEGAFASNNMNQAHIHNGILSNNTNVSYNNNKILSTNTTIGNIHSARNINGNHQKNFQQEEKQDTYKGESLAGCGTSNAIAQQLLNDVRALAAQNSKTEQNLKELQQKINQQKGKRHPTAVINNNNNFDKENDEILFHQRQAARTLSYNSTQNVKQTNGIQAGQQTYNQPAPTPQISNEMLENIQNNQKRGFKSEMVAEETQSQNNNNFMSIENPNSTSSMNPTRAINQAAVKQNQGNNKLGSMSSDRATTSSSTVVTVVTQNNQAKAKGTVDSSSESEKSNESISQRLARNIINNNYSMDILNYIKITEFKTVPKNCLLRHNIPASLRARMIDWMIEVTKSYKCSEETFFMAVRIMDHFFEKTKKTKEIHEIHLIGVTSLFIACKFEEIYPMRLTVLHERIAHKKLSEEQIKNMEAEILNTLQFNLLGTSPYDIAMQTLTLAGYQEKFSSEEFEYAHKICVYLCKMALYDYDFNKTSTYSLLAASIIYIIFKIFQQINVEFIAEQNIKIILQVLKISQKDLVSSSTRILHLAKNFEQFFPDLLNLKKFNGFEMKENEDFANSN